MSVGVGKSFKACGVARDGINCSSWLSETAIQRNVPGREAGSQPEFVIGGAMDAA